MPTTLALDRYPVASDSARAFESLLRDLTNTMREEPGLLWTEVVAPVDEPGSYILVSEWRTAADLHAWESGDPAVAFARAGDPMLTADPTRRRFASSDQGTPRP